MDCEQIETNSIAELYLMENLEPFKKAQFEIHFISCRKCTDLLVEMQDFREALKSVAPEFERDHSKATTVRRAWSRPMAVFVAAVVVIAVLPSVIVLRDNLRLHQQLSQARATQAQSTQPESQPEQNAAPSLPQDRGAEYDPSAGRARDGLPSSPQINTPMIVLNAVRGTPAVHEETNEIDIAPSQWFVLSVELEHKQFEEYRATILTHDRRFFWRSGNLRPDRHDAITIGCAPGFFRAGDYLLVLEGRSKSRSLASVATYPFRIARKTK